MNILVVGGNTQNKGAYLMLLAVHEQAKLAFGNVNVIVGPFLKNQEKLRSIGFKILDYPLDHVGSGKKFSVGLSFPTLMKYYLRLKNGKTLKAEFKMLDIDLVLDISGYAFSDKFGLSPMKNLQKQVQFFKRRNIPYVFMPQAFGPFGTESKVLMKEATQAASLAFARDQASFAHLELTGSAIDLHYAPDITLCVSSADELPGDVPFVKNYVCIVPNSQMIRKGSTSWQQGYQGILKKAVRLILADSTYNVIILVHSTSGGGDEKISKQLYEGFKGEQRVKMYQNDDPLQLKKVLKQSSMVVGSRFHALASSLSSNTPSIATSWAHKYEELFTEYGIEEYSHAELSDRFLGSVSDLLVGEEQKAQQQKLVKRNEQIRKLNKEMWQQIKVLV